jgi:quinol monooxygenase YgiN/sugar lactone lactonase YvrE
MINRANLRCITIILLLILVSSCKNEQKNHATSEESNMVKLLLKLPTKYNTPDGATLGNDGNIYISVPNFNNRYLVQNNVIDTPESSYIISIDKNNTLSEWYKFSNEDLHPETGFVGPMDLAFGPDGNLYIADMQIAYNPDYKSRLIRINIENGKPKNTEVLVEGFIACNGMVWEDNTLFITEPVLAHPSENNTNEMQKSGVYAFSLKELNDGNVIRLTPYSETNQDKHLSIKLETEPNRWGADGIVADDAGYIYTTAAGGIYKTLVGTDNKEVKTELLVKDSSKMESADGIIWNSFDKKLYTAGFSENALYSIDPDGKIKVLHKNGDTNGENGELDQPAEVVLRGNELIIINMDLGEYSSTDVNTKPDEPYTISVLNLKEPTAPPTDKLDRTMTPDAFSMFVKIHVQKKHLNTHKQALKENIAGTRTEEGNVLMELYQGKKDPNALFIFETWENRKALRYHFNTPWLKNAYKVGVMAHDRPTEVVYLQNLKPLPENKIKRLSNTDESVDIVVEFTVKEGTQKRFVEQFLNSVELTRNTEANNIAFDFYKVLGSDTEFVLYERWKDQKTLDDWHGKDDYANHLFPMFKEVLDPNTFDGEKWLNGVYIMNELVPVPEKR